VGKTRRLKQKQKVEKAEDKERAGTKGREEKAKGRENPQVRRASKAEARPTPKASTQTRPPEHNKENRQKGSWPEQGDRKSTSGQVQACRKSGLQGKEQAAAARTGAHPKRP
jgi:hypothetical protein